jgi:hypothetical protein
MTTEIIDLTINQGATFRHQFQWKSDQGSAINLTGFTARMQARVSISDAGPTIDMTTENGGIELSGISGNIRLYLSSAATELLTAGNGVYDLEMVSPDGEVTRLISGDMFISGEVTR